MKFLEIITDTKSQAGILNGIVEFCCKILVNIVKQNYESLQKTMEVWLGRACFVVFLFFVHFHKCREGWIKMDIVNIKELWKPNLRNLKVGIKWWNSKAERFSEKELPTTENSIAMRIIQQENMVGKGSRTLDVGCGGGRFSFVLEAMGAEATATDFVFLPPMSFQTVTAKRLESISKALRMTGLYMRSLTPPLWLCIGM
ncbi:hypothetical protein Desor_2898 [Desulfosporosinus orientis DSM 765]|uniref:Methyltransferase family protein n=1 Tax=Desulfosporosinus orientis (strain ATCC 19365 / DSM 765 / NCIMB 8382 / VKM B-1628 / Singapore I) TaxID=768706 RepID=G7WFI4_DESOD|nr:hypothetical protein [Desulfosporosinus orientis]AET68427.1 hypothetical protein Desor_2898 [Desulfosporosinus orientis DSM 765]